MYEDINKPPRSTAQIRTTPLSPPPPAAPPNDSLRRDRVPGVADSVIELPGLPCGAACAACAAAVGVKGRGQGLSFDHT